jgi:hypothetical protein
MEANTEVMAPPAPPAPVGGGDAKAGCGEKENPLPAAPELFNEDLLLRDSGDM